MNRLEELEQLPMLPSDGVGEQGDALRTGIVETALYHLAVGTEEVTRVWERKGDGEAPMVLTKVTHKKTLGSVTAQKLWLQSRAQDRWGEQGTESGLSVPCGVVELPAVLPEEPGDG